MIQADVIRGGMAVVHKDYPTTIEMVVEIGKMKTEQGWKDAVHYMGCDHNTGQLTHFYRELQSFCENFNQV